MTKVTLASIFLSLFLAQGLGPLFNTLRLFLSPGKLGCSGSRVHTASLASPQSRPGSPAGPNMGVKPQPHLPSHRGQH